MTKPTDVKADLQRLLQAVSDVEVVLRRGGIVTAAIALINGISSELKQLASKETVDSAEIKKLVESLDSAADALSAAVTLANSLANAPKGRGYTSPSTSPGGAPPKGR